jgi:hypothetical protein
MVGYTLEKNEAEVMATIVGLPGQLMFSGDKLGTLQYDRMKMIQQVLPVADIHPQNLYPYAASSMMPIWNLSVTRPFGKWRVVALFNFTDAPRSFDVSMDSLGLDAEKTYTVFEFWNGSWEGVVKGGIGCEIPMRTVRLFALWEAENRPQFVGDDRHLTQGAVGLLDEKWDGSRLVARIAAVGGFPQVVRFAVPNGWKLKSATADGVDAAAAANLVVTRAGAGSGQKPAVPLDVKINRSFLYAVIEGSTKIPLYVGVYDTAK